MRSLEQITGLIESATGVSASNFAHAAPFTGPSLFELCDFVDSHGSKPWNAISLYSGEEITNVSYEIGALGSYEWVGALLYFVTPDRASLVMVLPGADAGIQLASSPQALLPINDCMASRFADFEGQLDWAKLGERNIPWTSFVNEWKRLGRRFPDSPLSTQIRDVCTERGDTQERTSR